MTPSCRHGHPAWQGIFMRLFIVIAVFCCVLLTPRFAQASDRTWRDTSNIGRDALVIGALGTPLVQEDWQGALQASGSVGAATLVSLGLKDIFPETRPDGSDRRSFPSTHTATSFAAAATLQNRYGWKVGLPAHLVATIVGISRVQGTKHHWYDVAAGALLGEASGLLLTTRRNNNIRMLPWSDGQGGGIAMALRF
jgi:membrane-associated phospholipid phosphatase